MEAQEDFGDTHSLVLGLRSVVKEHVKKEEWKKKKKKKEEWYQEVKCMDSWIKEFLLSTNPVCNSVLSAAQVVTHLLISQKPCKRGTIIHHFTGG